MKILLAGGGTAGHINPALAIAGYAALQNKDNQFLFVGTEKGLESTLVPQAGYNIEYVRVEGLSKKLSIQSVKAVWHLLTAKKKAKKIIRRFAPDIVIGTGGYVCAPAVMAANTLGIPTMIHEQNVFPGSAIKFLAPKSDVTAISFEDSRKYLSDAREILFTGNPIRPAVLNCPREKARRALNLTNEKLIVIFGGSLGAEKINSVTLSYLSRFRDDGKTKILFATGERNYAKVMEAIKKNKISLGKAIEVKSYIHNMDEVLNAADLVISRSGAITVSELCALGKPAILIPSPNVTHNHQEYNARALSDNGAAVTILEKDFNVTNLEKAIKSILSNEKTMNKMQIQAAKISAPDATRVIYEKMLALTKAKSN